MKKLIENIQRGINLAIDDFDDFADIETQKAGQIKNTANTNKFIEFKNKWFVNLCLPSGTLWGKYNIGVDPTKLNMAQDWYGGYYAWGEIEEKQVYSWKTYKYANGDYNKLIKYCNNANFCDPIYKPDNLTTLQDEDDIAVQTNKLPWNVNMPTKEQIEELIIYTTSKWVENYQGINNLNGRLFTSKTNGNQMFIPAAGYRAGISVNGVGSSCNLWSLSLNQTGPSRAYRLYFNSSGCNLYAYSRFDGFSARQVRVQ